ncbi:hypothetical protein BpHYR1_007746 [Brachionus plicatilis]|uniref:Uncharacterized protein n=1 Tax=Brachionus plicatilis TaxID=10195 RepID=A0A3M7RP12_BRAPC|nr:hypothetical protein BpHYR1_007746 [Brachionus plicatilis]
MTRNHRNVVCALACPCVGPALFRASSRALSCRAALYPALYLSLSLYLSLGPCGLWTESGAACAPGTRSAAISQAAWPPLPLGLNIIILYSNRNLLLLRHSDAFGGDMTRACSIKMYRPRYDTFLRASSAFFSSISSLGIPYSLSCASKSSSHRSPIKSLALVFPKKPVSIICIDFPSGYF